MKGSQVRSVRLLCNNRLLLTIWLVCLVASTAGAGPRIVRPEDPQGSEVRQTAAEFYNDISKGNSAAAHALFAGPDDHAALLDAELDAAAASREMMRSILSRYLTDNPDVLAPPAVARFLRMGDRLLTGMIVLNGDEASTAADSDPDNGLLLRKIEGRWKVIHTTRESYRVAATRKYYTLMAAAFDEVRRRADGGEFKTADGAITMLGEKLYALDRQRDSAPRDAGRALAPATQPPPTAERLRSLMGRQIFSPQVVDLIDSLPRMPALAEYRSVLFINLPELGFDLTFKLPEGRLRAVHIYGGVDGRFNRYTGALPAGLAFGQPRIEIEQRLGRPASFSRSDSVGVEAEYPNLKLLARYAPSPLRNPRAPLTMVTLIEAPSFAGATTRPFDEPPPQLTIRPVLEQHDPAPADRLTDPEDPSGIATIRVSREAIIDQGFIANWSLFPDSNDMDRWKVAMHLTPEGGRRLAQATKNLVGHRVAVVLGSRVLMAPLVRDPIGEHFVIDFGPKAGTQGVDKFLREMSVAMMSLPAEPPAARKQPGQKRLP